MVELEHSPASEKEGEEESQEEEGMEEIPRVAISSKRKTKASHSGAEEELMDTEEGTTTKGSSGVRTHSQKAKGTQKSAASPSQKRKNAAASEGEEGDDDEVRAWAHWIKAYKHSTPGQAQQKEEEKWARR